MSRKKRSPSLPLAADELAAVRAKFDHPIRCPKCGGVDDLDGYDVLGLDEGNLYCNTCGCIDPMEDLADYICPEAAWGPRPEPGKGGGG